MLPDLLQHCNPRKLSRVKTSHSGISSRWWGAWPFIPFRMGECGCSEKEPWFCGGMLSSKLPQMYSAKRLKNLQHLTPCSKTKEKEDQNIRCSSAKKETSQVVGVANPGVSPIFLWILVPTFGELIRSKHWGSFWHILLRRTNKTMNLSLDIV